MRQTQSKPTQPLAAACSALRTAANRGGCCPQRFIDVAFAASDTESGGVPAQVATKTPSLMASVNQTGDGLEGVLA